MLRLLFLLAKNPLHAWTDEYFEAPVVRGGLPFMPAVVVSDPEGVQHVLRDNAANYRKDDLLQRILSPGLKNGLLTVEGEQWRRQRRALAPMFSPRSITALAPAMAEAADALIARWSNLPEGTVIDVAAEMVGVTLDVLERTIFPEGIGGDIDAFRDTMRTYFDAIGRIDPFDVLGLPDFLPRITRWRARKCLRFFNSAIDAVLAQGGQRRDNGDSVRSILGLLSDARDPQSELPLNEQEIRANVLTLIVAGHETTANALTWSLHLLGNADAWRRRAAEEADEVALMAPEEAAQHARIIRSVIDEALRLYPPIAAISRVALSPDEVCGHSVEAGTMTIIAPYVLHRHRLLWADPDEFKPQRFLEPSEEPVHRFAYLPFGAGPRICLGAAFALQEATIVLAHILRCFELRPVDGHPVEPLLRITLRPKGGLSMRLRRRPADGAAALPS